jgi:hypothetical protein
MRRLFVWLTILLLGSSLTALRAAAAPADKTAHIDDTIQQLPQGLGDIDVLEGKLADFERHSGIRILMEFHQRSPTSEEDKVAGAFMRELSGRLGVRQHGVLVVYFADESDWRVWIGDDLTPRLVGKPGTVKELTASGAIHNAKEAIFASAHAQADASLAELQKKLSGDEQLPPALRVRAQAAALLDALIAKLGPK